MTKKEYNVVIKVDKEENKKTFTTFKCYQNKNHIKTIIKSNISARIFEIILNNEFEGLKKFYNNIIEKHPNLIFESEDFRSLREIALGISQIPTLPTNLEEWSNENFEALKITLQ
ncbi:hypothetical protein Glove_64g53 [Diversispora epigaea]|uniref:Uncharacterized protein n=1 Tax=Diversispora epigaea TaxID=1348612 RepID=A0A397JM12_9GLOM|nr:hypothetical protein Glove_64g53 [Diversispora epigaea]